MNEKSIQPTTTVKLSNQFDLRGEIRFEGVHFAYQSGERPSLAGINITIPHGKKTVLVGPSGAGKSTILALLMGFIQPDSGQIFINEIALAGIPMEIWRREVAWMPQFPVLFNQTIADNLRVAHPDASAFQLKSAAKKAHAVEFIDQLPDGFATTIGERGSKLSGGQGQRLAVARAFLRDATLLLMDEPTTHLDIQNEILLQESVGELSHGKTVVMIAHRRATIRSADHIIVLDKGNVIQTGKHEDLLSVSGLYRELIFEGKG